MCNNVLAGGMLESVRPHSKPWPEQSNFEAQDSPPPAPPTSSVHLRTLSASDITANFSHSTTLRDTIMSLTGYMIESIMRGLNIANLGCFNADERLSPILEGCLLGGANVGCYHRCCLPYSRQHNIERDTSGVHPVGLVSDHAKPKVGPFQHHFIASTELRDAECQDQGSHMHRHTYSLSKLTPSTLNQSQA